MKHSPLSFVNLFNITIFTICFLAGCHSQQAATTAQHTAQNKVLSTTTVLIASPDLTNVSADSASDTILDMHFSELGGGAVYKIKRDGMDQVVHNGVGGKKYQEVLYVRLSRDGTRVAYSARTETKWRMVVDGVEGMYFDDVGTPVFSPDGKHILYDAKLGEEWHLVVNGKMNKEACSSYYDKVFSKDSQKIIALENAAPDNSLARVVVRDLQFKVLSTLEISGSGVKYNRDKSRFALISEHNGKKRVRVVSMAEALLVSEGQPFDEISRVGFGRDGVSFAYVGQRKEQQFVVRNESEEALPAGELGMEAPQPRPGQRSAALPLVTAQGAYMHFALDSKVFPQKRYDEVAFPAFDATGRSFAYCARNGKQMFYVVNGKESPDFDKVLAPEFSPDGARVVARVKKSGKRFVVVMDSDGKVLREHPPYDMVYATTFTDDGSSVAYGVKDGDKLIWKVEKL